MRRWRSWLGLLLLAGFIAAGFLISSCSSPASRNVMAPLEIPGAHFVGNKVCADCHAPIARTFPGSIHARVHFDQEKLPGGTSCEACHGPGSRHVEGGGGRGKFIINPRRESSACFQCHIQQQAEFKLPHHHPVLENKMNCTQCHDPHGSDIFKSKRGLAMSRLNESCADCHRQQTRPFVYEHEALREGCVVCHTPHGSTNSKMLAQNDPNLCLKCHAQVVGAGGNGTLYIGKVPHTDLLRQGTCWSSGCHTAVHGSNVSPRMFY